MQLITLAIPFLAWFYLLFKLRPLWSKYFPKTLLGTFLDLCLFVALMLIPVVDEILGGIQFTLLCNAELPLKIDSNRANGRTVRLTVEPSNKQISGTIIPMRYSLYVYRDTDTNEVITQYKTYAVDGGRLIHFLGIVEGNSPLVLSKTSCRPLPGKSIPKMFNFYVLN
jgi:hypothetical protein